MDETQQRIAASARALAAAFQDKQTDIAAVLGISQNAVQRRLNGVTRWTTDDVDALAKHYGVSTGQIMAGPRAWLGLDAAA